MAKKPGDIVPVVDGNPTAGTSSDIEKYTGDATEADGENLDLSADERSSETANIRSQIEETRADLGETIDAIQERLSFANISEQVSEQVSNAIETAKDTVYDATIGKAAGFMKNTGRGISQSSIVTAAKENPLPFILIGAGAALLAYQSLGRKTPRRIVDYQTGDALTGASEWDRGSSIVQTAQDKIRTVKETVAEAAGSAYEGVTRAAEGTYANAGELAHRAREKAGELGTKAQETYTHYLEEKPWAIGAVALVAGAAIGMAIPSTRYEGELMGEARINLLNKVQDTAADLVDKARNAANETGRTVVG